ncbi:tRNA (adenosine(37)-N6)-threonylcarbamoyltransferase complex ATPase subunit type 1 TsaE [Aeribacillus pallidus]|nr:tRNA (adenosine(37)-N6)-threonylcarbamoyltransferase complex ATPase subunit type 1 TsaE [Aeribacillus pallidus]
MDQFEIKTTNPEETGNMAMKLAQHLQAGDVITLEGDLGAGKTTFVKGLAKGLGIGRTVSSPTFTIMKEYTDGRLPLYHMDVYRIENSDEDLGFDEFFDGDGVTVVEWAHYIEDQLPEERLDIFIRYIQDNARSLIFRPKGKRYIKLCKEFFTDDGISD